MFTIAPIGAPTGVPNIRNCDTRLLLTATVIKNDLVSMVLNSSGDLVMIVSAAGGLGRIYGVALKAGVSGDIISIRVAGIVDINCQGLTGATVLAAANLVQGTGVVMRTSSTTSTGRVAVAGDSCCAITGLGQSVAASTSDPLDDQVPVSLKCWFDGVNFLGTKHS